MKESNVFSQNHLDSSNFKTMVTASQWILIFTPQWLVAENTHLYRLGSTVPSRGLDGCTDENIWRVIWWWLLPAIPTTVSAFVIRHSLKTAMSWKWWNQSQFFLCSCGVVYLAGEGYAWILHVSPVSATEVAFLLVIATWNIFTTELSILEAFSSNFCCSCSWQSSCSWIAQVFFLGARLQFQSEETWVWPASHCAGCWTQVKVLHFVRKISPSKTHLTAKCWVPFVIYLAC